MSGKSKKGTLKFLKKPNAFVKKLIFSRKT